MQPSTPNRLATTRVIDQGIDQDFAESLLSVATYHLGNSVRTVEHIGWARMDDADNWVIVAFVATGSYCATVERRCDVGVLKQPSVRVFRPADLKHLVFEEDGDVFAYMGEITRDSAIKLPRTLRATELWNIR